MPPEPVRRRLAVIWNADAAGYSRLMSADDAGTLAELRARRDALRAAVVERGGRVVDAVGDNLLAEFSSAVAAVEGAINAQEKLAARDAGLPESMRLPFRIGIHLGEVIVDGDALAGDAVNVSARICALTDPGDVWISKAVHDQVRGKIGLELQDRGEHRLKNIPSPVHVYRVGSREARRPAPPATDRNQRPAIAVLPFQNLSSDPEQEYLADAIAQDLVTRMARWVMPIVAQQSSFSLRGTQLDAREIGRKLGARYLVEGSIQRSSNRVRLSVQLIDTDSGEQVWAARFERELSELFALQDEVARAIEASLGAGVARREEARVLGRDPESVDAWDAYVRATWHLNRATATATAADWRDATVANWRESQRFARLAVELDPRFARALALLAIVEYNGLFNEWTDERDESISQARSAATRAVQLDPHESAAHTAIALARLHDGDRKGAQIALERALELAGETSETVGDLGWLHLASGDFEAAVPLLEKAAELEASGMSTRPAAYAVRHFQLACAHFGAGRDAEALRWAERAAKFGDHPVVRGLAAAMLGHLGRIEEAKQQLEHLPGIHLSDAARVMRSYSPAFVARLLAGLRLAGMTD